MDDDLYSKQNKKKREQRFNNNEHYGEEIERPKSVTRTDSPRGEVTMAELKTGNKRAVGNESVPDKSVHVSLTSDPKASDIRPPAVLKKALALVEEKWKSREWTYDQLKEQLKSIRQDLTVQRRVLWRFPTCETHARVALEHDDLAEYNQCQTVLKTLHERYINEEKFKDSRGEFAAYRLLYALIADESGQEWSPTFHGDD